MVENLARERAKQLFGAEYANVQPHSGSSANMEAYAAVVQPGDTVMGLDLAHGGHLTHGHKLSFSGKTYHIVSYGVSRETETIDYDELQKIAERERPKLIIGGGSAYPRIIDFARMRQIADLVGAVYLVDMAHFAGLVAGGVHPSPVPHAQIVTSTTHKTLRGPRAGLILCKEAYAKAVNSQIFPGIQGGPLEHVIAAKAVSFYEILHDNFMAYAKQIIANAQAMAKAFTDKGYNIVSGGTDNHLMLIDLRNKNISGKKAENTLVKADITINKNMVPFDDKSPFITSGIRVGVSAMTTRGLKEAHMPLIVNWLDRVLMAPDDETVVNNIKGEVNEFMTGFPLYPEWSAAGKIIGVPS